MDTFAVGTALATALARRFAQTAGAARTAPAGRLWARLLPRLDASPDAAGALRELRRNPRNRAAGLVLGDEIGHVLAGDPELLGSALAVVGGPTGPVPAAA